MAMLRRSLASAFLLMTLCSSSARATELGAADGGFVAMGDRASLKYAYATRAPGSRVIDVLLTDRALPPEVLNAKPGVRQKYVQKLVDHGRLQAMRLKCDASQPAATSFELLGQNSAPITGTANYFQPVVISERLIEAQTGRGGDDAGSYNVRFKALVGAEGAYGRNDLALRDPEAQPIDPQLAELLSITNPAGTQKQALPQSATQIAPTSGQKIELGQADGILKIDGKEIRLNYAYGHVGTMGKGPAKLFTVRVTDRPFPIELLESDSYQSSIEALAEDGRINVVRLDYSPEGPRTVEIQANKRYVFNVYDDFKVITSDKGSVEAIATRDAAEAKYPEGARFKVHFKAPFTPGVELGRSGFTTRAAQSLAKDPAVAQILAAEKKKSEAEKRAAKLKEQADTFAKSDVPKGAVPLPDGGGEPGQTYRAFVLWLKKASLGDLVKAGLFPPEAAKAAENEDMKKAIEMFREFHPVKIDSISGYVIGNNASLIATTRTKESDGTYTYIVKATLVKEGAAPWRVVKSKPNVSFVTP